MDLLDWAHGQQIDRANDFKGNRWQAPKKRTIVNPNEFVPTVDYRIMQGAKEHGRVWIDGKYYPTPDHPQWANLPETTQAKILAKMGGVAV